VNTSQAVNMVPLGDVTKFAREVQAMLRAHERLLAAALHGVVGSSEYKRRYREAKDHERRVKRMAGEFFSREKQPLPMFEEGGAS
jgi:hypothetical protein